MHPSSSSAAHASKSKPLTFEITAQGEQGCLGKDKDHLIFLSHVLYRVNKNALLVAVHLTPAHELEKEVGHIFAATDQQRSGKCGSREESRHISS